MFQILKQNLPELLDYRAQLLICWTKIENVNGTKGCMPKATSQQLGSPARGSGWRETGSGTCRRERAPSSVQLYIHRLKKDEKFCFDDTAQPDQVISLQQTRTHKKIK